MSGLFGSVTIKGNRLTDFAQTTATVGIPLPFGYGTVPFDGNVIWAPLPPKEHVTKKRQGKGGTKTETYTYTLSYAVGFCRGPIYGYWWIKRNGKVVWTQDPNAPVEDHAYAAKWAQKAQFYFGTATQLPDSTIESYEGSGQVSAFRDVAFIVVEDDDVTDGSGAVPTYEACCICSPPDVYLTSRPYNMFTDDTMTAGWVGRRGVSIEATIDNMDIPQLSMLDGRHREVIQKYSHRDELDMPFTPLAGILKTVLARYQNWPAEPLDFSFTPRDGTLVETLVRYQNWPAEPLDFSFTPLNGTLT